ncbi:melanoma antigen preferentially expressed in tumors-like [Peromyscus californicus insignis]|uniref:melanoma antigen preferentially expressed in tumors-like n=1 Tax=Peromyscus californicus insignis TaxID=564181 RepID=UPI0022A73981|nr:melanoma antigen preferentially expressed in tumors-like [Peromyscus californicus insignis]
MDAKNPKTLLDLAIQSLLRNESAAIQALEDMPRVFFVPLFIAAFEGGHKNTLREMVKVWPYYCLHIGSLTVQDPQHELQKPMIENLPVHRSRYSASRRPKLRILDLRQDNDCRTTSYEVSIKEPFCFHSCAYSDSSILKIEGQHHFVNSESMVQFPRPVELLVDLTLDGSLVEIEFMVLLTSKIRESSGSLHICCLDLQVNKLCDSKYTLNFLHLNCVGQLSIDTGLLSDITNVLSQIDHLESLSLSKVTFRSPGGKLFKNFLGHLQRMNNLKEVSLSSFCLTGHLDRVLRVLPPGLHFLYLTFCDLSYRDFRFLAQSPHFSRLKLLNLSNNPVYWDDFEPFQTLLVNLSSTLRHLEINHCLINDTAISVLIPALIRCTQLRVLCFASNPITMPMLVTIMNNLTPLKNLKYVIYPIPVHCYELWPFQGSVDRRKLAIVQLQLKVMLELAERADMNWITYLE